MKVELTYFRPSGKYHSTGEYQTKKIELWEIWAEVIDKLNTRTLPGLCKEHSRYIVSVRVPDHKYQVPHLVGTK